MGYSTPLGLVAPDGSDRFPSEAWWKRLADTADERIRQAWSSAAKAANDAQKAGAAAQAVANAAGLTPPDWTVVDSRYLIADRIAVDVTQHGVVGDGVADDGPAMRAIVNEHAGKTLVIPRTATVKMAGALNLWTGTTLTGGGKLALSGPVGLSITDPFVTLDDIVLSGTATKAVDLYGAGSFTARRCRFSTHENAIVGTAPSSSGGAWRIIDNTFGSSLGTGLAISIGGTTAAPLQAQVEGNRFGGGYRSPKVAFGYMASDFQPRGNMGALPDMQAGLVTISGKPAVGDALAFSVTFPRTYVDAPNVVATPANSRLSVGVSTVTTTGFSGYVGNWSDAATTDANTLVRWMALPGAY